jgi:hypothetical protein
MDRIKTEKYKLTIEDLEFLIRRHLEENEHANMVNAIFDWSTIPGTEWVVCVKTEIAVQTFALEPKELPEPKRHFSGQG